MDLHLLIHNVGAIISIVVSLGVVVFLLVNNPRKTVNITLALTNFFVAVFIISHLLGTNTADAHLSKLYFMFNLSTILLVLFTMHTVFAIMNKTKERKKTIIFFYCVSAVMIIGFLLFPDTFLLDSVPKMYFPNYYNPGQFHWVMRAISNLIIPLYILWELIDSYMKDPNIIERNRAKYFILTMIVGYVIGSIPILLVFNIPVDPAWGIWFVPIYSIPLVYGAVTYQMVDVRVVAKKAFLYAVSVAAIGAVIGVFNYVGQTIVNTYPSFPFWISPLISGAISVAIGYFIWKQLRQGDVLKNEFMTTVTHKFRTPLTHIKWATENLAKVPMQVEGKSQLRYIRNANDKLIELTNVLMNVSESEDSDYSYHFEKTNMTALVKEVAASLSSQLEAKELVLDKFIDQDIFTVIDIPRIKFVVQVFLENAIQYTAARGHIEVRLARHGRDVVYSVHDSGIGLSKEEIPMLFSKFYRTGEAKLADTEGMGIGLFVSKETIQKHRGKIWAESEGLNRGSTFAFSLPASV